MPGRAATGLVRAPLLLGRGEDCDAHLPGTEISRHHAEVVREGPLWVLRDLGSTNGVFLNGARVVAVPLSSGDVLRVGEWIGLITEAAAADAAQQVPFLHEHGIVAGPILGPVLSTARSAATTDLPIVIQGETGTGKEMVARAIHAWSRRPGPYSAINCAALPESLAEAELFGYRKGAFTGAERASLGHLRAAQGGTLLLDEITDLPLALQPKLLRALEQHEIIPVGESAAVAIDVRVVAATQRSLRDQARDGRFRADLQARLDGVTVVLPPLRERLEEVVYLFEWFLKKHSGGQPPALDPALVEALCLHDWPANVRELELLARRLIGLHPGEMSLRPAHLPEHMLRDHRSAPQAGAINGYGAEESRDLARLVRALRLHAGNIARASAEAGFSRHRAYHLLKLHPEIDVDALRRVARRSGR